jgi:hypothetical protein
LLVPKELFKQHQTDRQLLLMGNPLYNDVKEVQTLADHRIKVRTGL